MAPCGQRHFGTYDPKFTLNHRRLCVMVNNKRDVDDKMSTLCSKLCLLMALHCYVPMHLQTQRWTLL